FSKASERGVTDGRRRLCLEQCCESRRILGRAGRFASEQTQRRRPARDRRSGICGQRASREQQLWKRCRRGLKIPDRPLIPFQFLEEMGKRVDLPWRMPTIGIGRMNEWIEDQGY